MNNFDSYLKRRLKNATAHSRPPANARARLLKAASGDYPAYSSDNQPPISVRRHMERRQRPRDWSTRLMALAMIDAFNSGALNMRILY
jgi:hypothetical protein